jgi:signal transduction histidine kinase
MRSPRELLSNFVLTTVGGLVLVAALTLAATEWIVGEFALEDGEVHNKMIARALSNALEPELRTWLKTADPGAPAATGSPAYAALTDGIARVSKDLPVLKVKVYRPDGIIVHSGGLDEYGDRTPRSNAAFWAAAAGQASSQVEFDEDFVGPDGTAFFRDAVSSYLPIVYDGQIAGVFEIYGDYAIVVALADQYFPLVAVVVLAACLLLYGIVTLFVWRAQRALTRARDDLANARERAEAASQAKSSFLANMSHELRTPLNAIVGFSEVLETEAIGPLGSNPKYREYARDIRLSGTHLRSLIDDVLDMAKIEAGRVELEAAAFDLRAQVETCARIVRGRIEEAGQILELQLPHAAVWVRSDARLLRQVLLNLLSNASKFTPAGGTIRLSLETRTDAFAIEVRDSGIGMTPSELEVARQPFGQAVRGKRVSGGAHGGTGLGLPISTSLIELLGGRLVLESEADVGTTARVVLPVSAVVPQSSPAAAPRTARTARPVEA